MLLSLALALTIAAPNASQRPRFATRDCQRSSAGRSARGLPCGAGTAFFSVASSSGGGMGTACACANITGAKGETLTFVRASVAECYSNNGQNLTQCAAGFPRVSSGSAASSQLGYWSENTKTNLALFSRDWSNAVWVKATMTCALTATGMRSDANSASTCTATAAAATVLQTITTAAAVRTSSWHIKRRTGTGTIEATRNGGANWYAITSLVSSSFWRRVVPLDTPGCMGGNCITVPEMTSSVLNPSFGIRLGTSGDAVDLDFAQDEDGEFATSPILTTTVSAPRSADVLYADLGVTSGISMNVNSFGVTTLGPAAGAPSGISLYLSAIGAADSSGTNAAWLYTGASGVAGELQCFVGNAAGVLERSGTPGAGVQMGHHYCSNSATTKVTGKTGINPMLQSPNVPTGTFGQVRYVVIGNLGSGGFAANSVIKDICLDSNPGRCAEADPALPGSSTDVIWIGDSIIAGAFSGPRSPPALLSSLLRRFVHQGGSPGATVSGYVAGSQSCSYVWSLVRTMPASTIVWSCGVNDVANGADGNVAAAAAQIALADMRSLGKKVIITGIMPWGTYVSSTAPKQSFSDAYNASQSTWAGANGAFFVSTNSMGTSVPLQLTVANDSGDGLHPSVTGSRALVDLVLTAAP